MVSWVSVHDWVTPWHSKVGTCDRETFYCMIRQLKGRTTKGPRVSFKSMSPAIFNPLSPHHFPAVVARESTLCYMDTENILKTRAIVIPQLTKAHQLLKLSHWEPSFQNMNFREEIGTIAFSGFLLG